jgi:hypothetical protein
VGRPPTGERATNNADEEARIREAERARAEFMKKLSSNPRSQKSKTRGDAYIIVGYPKP